jgi:hypothetical protein
MRKSAPTGLAVVLFLMFWSLLTSSCTRLLGWGVLLWSTDDPVIPSGTVLPVYIRSSIDHVWVVGIPEEYRFVGTDNNKFELPLWQLEFLGSKRAARERAAAFSEFAHTYAETMQDGLPIRDDSDNGARRVYRLRMGQIIKILSRVQGNSAISATGDPLPGDWYRVLTEDGTTGYCFSYRLRLFEHAQGPLTLVPAGPGNAEEDPDLEMVLSQIWYPESYGTMVNTRRIDLDDLSKKWQFSPGQDTGIAHIYLPTLDKTFLYTGIQSTGNRTWRFDGAPLQMSLRSNTTLAVQYSDGDGVQRTALFVTLPINIEDLILQETDRQQALFHNLYTQGPVFISANYGTLSFAVEGKFSWSGYDLLVPQIIPSSALGSGAVHMNLFLSPSLQEQYNGAFSLHFNAVGGSIAKVNFIYMLDTQGLRIEYVPMDNLDGLIVSRRSMSPLVIYFFRKEPVQGSDSGAGFTPVPGFYDLEPDSNFYPEFDTDPDLYPEDDAPEYFFDDNPEFKPETSADSIEQDMPASEY